MRMYDIIEKKRDGFQLTKEEIDFVIEGYTKAKIPDYQMSALLMAIYFQGMTIEESTYLTNAIVHSGKVVDLSSIPGIKVDKHSTGGVGDSVTLVLTPLVASAGVYVPKMSGRGLGHTGGTIDKLEAIPGFHVKVTEEKFVELVKQNNMAVIAQSEHLVPADKQLYSLRDVTATVNSIPLIASSIMSKKLASGADKIVLDVKVGSGAFMKTLEDAEILANTMVEIGRRLNKETIAILSNMNQPLGYAVGNSLEVKEAIETLQGNGPDDLTELSLELGSYMLILANIASSLTEAKRILKENIKNKTALQTFKQFIKAQGGDVSYIEQPEKLPQAPVEHVVRAKKSGYVSAIDANKIGKTSVVLGAGRKTKDDSIDLSVGIVLHKKIGDFVAVDEPLFTVYMNNYHTESIEEMLLDSFSLGKDKLKQELILKTIT